MFIAPTNQSVLFLMCPKQQTATSRT